MNENNDYPVLDFKDCLNYIVDKTKLDDLENARDHVTAKQIRTRLKIVVKGF